MQQKPEITVVFIGHKSCGKSTLAGHLLSISKDTGIGPELPFSFLVDRLPPERSEAQTLNFSLSVLETPKYEFTLVNVPGKPKLLKTMIRGTSQSDAAILVVSASPDEFEMGLARNGQTRWHPLLAYTFGIKQLIVCINKIDENEITRSEVKYQEIKKKIEEVIKKIGYPPQKVHFVPVSALTGENLIEKSNNLDWYKGPTLLEAMESLVPPSRVLSEKPLRMPIQRVQKVRGFGTVPIGKLQSGKMKVQDLIYFSLGRITTEVRTIETNHKRIAEAITRMHIGFHIKGFGMRDTRPGDVIGNVKDDPPRNCEEFVAQVIILNHPKGVRKGYTPVISVHMASIACRFEEIISKITKATGNVEDDMNGILKNGESGMVRMIPLKPLCVEPFQDYPNLGRFAIRDMSTVIGVGIIKSVSKKPIYK